MAKKHKRQKSRIKEIPPLMRTPRVVGRGVTVTGGLEFLDIYLKDASFAVPVRTIIDAFYYYQKTGHTFPFLIEDRKVMIRRVEAIKQENQKLRDHLLDAAGRFAIVRDIVCFQKCTKEVERILLDGADKYRQLATS